MDSTPTVSLMDEDRGVGVPRLRVTPILREGVVQGDLRLRLERRSLGEHALACRAVIENAGAQPASLAGLRWASDRLEPKLPPLRFPREYRPQLINTENLRADYISLGTVDGPGIRRDLHDGPFAFGDSEDRPFPGCFIAATTDPVGMLIAQGSQGRFHWHYRFRGLATSRNGWLFDIEERPTGLEAVRIDPGGTLHGEWLILAITATNDPEHAMGAYDEFLEAEGGFRRRNANPLVNERIYCSWNYDFFAKIDEQTLLEQVPIIKRHLPNVGFFQVDDGYQPSPEPGVRANIDLLYGDTEPFDLQRFPSGPKGLADRVREAGLRPAIWLGLRANRHLALAREHPEWLLHDDCGEPVTLLRHWVVLDPSVPAVQDYFEHVAATVFGEWGYEGLKLDFSSFAFEMKTARFRYGDRSAVEYRHWLETLFRTHLPHDGFFGWCVVCGTATPFLPEADYFRHAEDIDRGQWQTVKRIAAWTANTIALYRRWSSLPNIDSIGYSEHMTATQWESWLNLAAISGMALEVSGDLRPRTPTQLRRMQDTLALSDPNRTLFSESLSPVTLHTPPTTWRSLGREGDQRIAIFNWDEQPRRLATLCGEDVLTALPRCRVLSGESHDANEELTAETVLAPHQSILVEDVTSGASGPSTAGVGQSVNP